MSETWIVLALDRWVVLMVVSWFLDPPGARPTRPATASGRAWRPAIGITHLLLVVQLYLMIWKPGSDLTWPYAGALTRPVSSNGKYGLWAISHRCPSGSAT